MDTQALSIACKHMEEHGDKVVADLKKQLSSERRQNTILQRKVDELECRIKARNATILETQRECDRLRTHLTATVGYLNGLGRQCDEQRRRLEHAKWSE